MSEPASLTCLPWVAVHGMAHNFTELHKALYHGKAVIHEGAKAIQEVIDVYARDGKRDSNLIISS